VSLKRRRQRSRETTTTKSSVQLTRRPFCRRSNEKGVAKGSLQKVIRKGLRKVTILDKEEEEMKMQKKEQKCLRMRASSLCCCSY